MSAIVRRGALRLLRRGGGGAPAPKETGPDMSAPLEYRYKRFLDRVPSAAGSSVSQTSLTFGDRAFTFGMSAAAIAFIGAIVLFKEEDGFTTWARETVLLEQEKLQIKKRDAKD